MKVPVIVMRGETTKGVFLNFEDMQADRLLWNDFLLDTIGSLNRRQIEWDRWSKFINE